MIRIQQLKLNIEHSEADLRKKISKTLHVKEDALLSFRIKKRSLDARKKPELYFIYTVDAEVQGEKQILKKNKNKDVSLAKDKVYLLPENGTEEPKHRPVIIGCGPAGLFCGYLLAEKGYHPIFIEQGKQVEERQADVEEFWKTKVLNPNSNVQFGEGGAGTFSDGKLNTLVKDSFGRNGKVLETFVKFGAPEEILYINKPHIGTDVLMGVIRNMREALISMGADFCFSTKVIDFVFEGQKLKSLKLEDVKTKETRSLDADIAVLCIGHSSRDTFQVLYDRGVDMQAKSFAVGVRVEHEQTMINHSQYGKDEVKGLKAAAYKLTANLENGRGVYTFCMCPGGYVVNASSEEKRLAVNGMSYHARDGKNANSAVIVTVTPKDYGDGDALSGVAFQRRLEEKAYELGNGRIPVQRFEDFKKNEVSKSFGKITPSMKGEYCFANVRSIFPEELSVSLEEGITAFDRKISGYACDDTLLSGVESRTSSPVKIVRGETLESNMSGLYPCGEGAGYAGGIMSAAMDGLKVAETIIKSHCPGSEA